MGDKLKNYFDEAKKLGGFKAELRIAMITRITRLQAETMPDEQDKIQMLEQAMIEIKKEFH